MIINNNKKLIKIVIMDIKEVQQRLNLFQRMLITKNNKLYLVQMELILLDEQFTLVQKILMKCVKNSINLHLNQKFNALHNLKEGVLMTIQRL